MPRSGKSMFATRRLAYLFLASFLLLSSREFALTASAGEGSPSGQGPPYHVEFIEPQSASPETLERSDPPKPNRQFSMKDAVMAPSSRVVAQGRPRDKGETSALHWKSGDAHLAAGIDPAFSSLYDSLTKDPAGKTQFGYVVVQYAWEPTPGQMADILNSGYQELGYVPESAHVVRIPVAKLGLLAEQPFVRAIVPLRPEWKLAPDLADAMESAGEAPLAVRLVAFESLSLPAPSPLERQGGSLEYRGLLTPPEILAYLRDPLVQWVEPDYQDKLSLDTSVDVIGADNVHVAGGLDGTGVKVGVIDSGINLGHAHFSGVSVIKERDWVDGDHDPVDCLGHGTYCAGIVAGGSTPGSRAFTAVAPNATLIVERISDCDGKFYYDSYGEIFDEVVDRGAQIISASWGHDSARQYDAAASNVDFWAREHENVTLVYANGNYPATNNVDSPGLAKNVIAVGASRDGSPATGTHTADSAADVDLVSQLNDLNPVLDGRVKPDVNAPGEWITSPYLGTAYGTFRGSSSSTPHIAGLIALYLQQNPGRRADEIKAGLINSAVDLGDKPGQTGHLQGWGRASAYDFLYEVTGEALDGYFRGDVGDTAPFSSLQSFPFLVPSGTRYVKVTMTYLDRAAFLNANPALVNDLDLALRSPSGVVYWSDSRVNNVEQVLRYSPEPGTWTIYVQSYLIPGAAETHQEYAGNVSVVTGTPSLLVSVSPLANVLTDYPFAMDISLTASGWAAYGAYSFVEVLDSNIQLADGSPSAAIAGDMWSETRSWSPSFVASSCGYFANAVRVTVGATNFSTSSRLVSLDVPCAQYTISGYVRTGGGTGIGGVTLAGLPATPTTDSSGFYSAHVDENWSGTVTPQKAGYTFSPSSRSYTNVTGDWPSQDYTGTPLPAGPLVHDGHWLYDDNFGDSVGNGNGFIQCGETIELFVTLRNQGAGPAQGVDATLDLGADPYVELLFNDTSSYPEIPGGGTGFNDNDFDLKVAANTPHGHEIHIDLEVTASSGGPWEVGVDLPVACVKVYAPIAVREY